MREIEVECLPLDIPEFFNVDVSELDIGDASTSRTCQCPRGSEAIYESNFALVTVATPTVEETPTPVAEPVEGAPIPAATKERIRVLTDGSVWFFSE